MSIRCNLVGPFRGLPSLEPEAGPSLEPETSRWDSEDELPSLAPSNYGSLEGVGSPFRGLPSLDPGPLDIFAVRIVAPFPTKIERITTIALTAIRGSVDIAYSAENTMFPRLEVARTARRHLLERVEQEIATLESTQNQLWVRRADLELEASQLRKRLQYGDAASTARRHLLERVEQEIATVESSQVELRLRRVALQIEASQLRRRLR